jgi:hypothetical protein
LSLDLSPDTDVHTIWFVGWGTGDLLAYVFRPPDGEWIGEYRFRHHTAPKTGDPFTENDVKNFYTFKTKHRDDPPDSLVAMMEMVCSMTQQHYDASLFDRLVINGKGPDAEREMRKQSWCFVKEVPRGQA